MNKRKRNVKDDKTTSKKRNTLENWFRSSVSNCSQTTNNVIEDGNPSLQENVDPLTDHCVGSSSAETLSTYADTEMTSLKQNDLTSKESGPEWSGTDDSSAATIFIDFAETNAAEENASTLKENRQEFCRPSNPETKTSTVGFLLTDLANVENRSNQISSSSSTQLEQYTLPDCFEKVGTGRKNIRCKVCFSQLNVVSIFVHNGKHHIPVICTEKGDQNRKTLVDKHILSECHKSAVRSQRMASISQAQLVGENTIERGGNISIVYFR